MRYAIISNNSVVNVIEYDSQPSTPPPGFNDDHIAVQSGTAQVGWGYIGGTFVAPAVPEPTPEQAAGQAESLLAASDWSMLADVDLANKADWVKYRAALRSIRLSPKAYPTWPTRPPADWS